MNAVLKQSQDVLTQILPTLNDRESCLSQAIPFLELQNPPLFSTAAKSLLIPNPSYTVPLLNMPPVTLGIPNALGALLPAAPNPSFIPTGHLMRIKGMPPGTTVNDILDFLGIYWRTVALHGIHLIYSAMVIY